MSKEDDAIPVVPNVDAIKLYEGQDGNIVIEQEVPYEDPDLVLIPVKYVDHFIDGLKKIKEQIEKSV